MYQIPPGMVWLEGDNPFNSTDSRSYGPVPLALIKGIVCFKVCHIIHRHGVRIPDTHHHFASRVLFELLLQLYPLHEFGPLPRTFRKPGVTYPKLEYGGTK